jgi:hypothetical protein
VLQPNVQRAALGGFLGSVVVFFLIVAAALVYWSMSNRSIAPDPGERNPPGATAGDEVGTVGETTAGGQDPASRPGSTRDELESRGAGGLAASLPLTDVGAILVDDPATVAGRRVMFTNVEVASTSAGSLWIQDGDAKVEVILPSGAPAVRTGQSVNVSGTVESDGRGVRIRATRVDEIS